MNYVTCNDCNDQVQAQNPQIVQLSAKYGYQCRKCRAGQHWTKANYNDYLKSVAWQIRRDRALRKALHRCQICNGIDALQVHHNTYKRLGHELDSDLLVVCETHHKMIHGLLICDEYESVFGKAAELVY